MFQIPQDKTGKQRLAGYVGFTFSAVLVLLLSFGVINVGPSAPDRFTVKFDIGTSLDDGASAAIDAAAARLAEEPAAILVVTGHTGTSGDVDANQALSEARADAVAQRLLEAGVSDDRIVRLGAAGELPAPRDDGMSDAAYERALPRAVIVITDRSHFNSPRG